MQLIDGIQWNWYKNTQKYKTEWTLKSVNKCHVLERLKIEFTMQSLFTINSVTSFIASTQFDW